METLSPSNFESEDAFDAALAKAERTLDAFLSKPSSSFQEFAAKVAALSREYGDEWQGRHVKALRADIAALAAKAGRSR